MKTKTYYILCAKTEFTLDTYMWEMEFGDYDKKVVKEELQDYRDSGYKKKDLKIVECEDSHEGILAAVKKLNDELHSSGELSVQL